MEEKLMVRSVLISALFAVSTIVPAVSQTGASESSAREQDVYAIYSQMLTNLTTSHGANTNERYLIMAATVPGTPGDPCIEPPADRAADFREVLSDFERRKDNPPRKLKREFTITKTYVLVSAEQVKKFVKSRRSSLKDDESSSDEFRGVTDLIQLSDVYFNPSRTLALSAISTWCGSLCARYEWKVFEKRPDGSWQELPWVSCITVS